MQLLTICYCWCLMYVNLHAYQHVQASVLCIPTLKLQVLPAPGMWTGCSDTARWILGCVIQFLGQGRETGQGRCTGGAQICTKVSLNVLFMISLAVTFW